MKLIQATFLSLIALGAGSAFADDSGSDNANGSQFQWQTPSGVMELTPELSWMQMTAKFKDSQAPFTKQVDTNTAEKLSFAYGINDMFAVSVTLGAGNSSTKTSVNAGPTPDDVNGSGMLTPNVTFRGRMPMSNGSFRYGVSGDFSVEDNKTKSNGKQNVSSGQTRLTPFVGYEMAVTPDSLVGARISYGINVGDQKRSADTGSGIISEKVSGGEPLSVDLFYEMNMSPVRLGANLGVTATRKTTIKANGQSADQSDANTDMHLGIYVPVTITKSIVILPEVTYTKATAYDSSVIDSADGFGVDVAARFSF